MRNRDCLSLATIDTPFSTGPRARTVRRDPAQDPGALRPARRIGLLRAAHRAPQPRGVLRRAPARVRREHADQEGARTARHRRAPGRGLRARNRSRDRGDRGGARQSRPGRPRRVASIRRGGRPAHRACDRVRRSRSSGHPLLDRREALWTILEHEEMHQETLAYMWHQVPHARKHKPAGYVTLPPHARAQPMCSACRIPGGRSPRSAPAFAKARSGGTTSARRTACRSTHSRSTCYNVTNAEFLEFVEAGGYREARWWRRGGLGLDRSRKACRHPAILGARRRSWFWRGMFERCRCLGVARLCHMGGGAGVCVAGEGCGSRPKPSFTARPSGRPMAASGGYPWGRRPRTARRRATSISIAGTPSPLAPIPRAPARSACTISSATAGSGPPRRSRPFDGFDAAGVLSGVLRRLLRRRPLRDEGRLAAHRSSAGPARVPQLVPPALSVRLRNVPVRGRGVMLQPIGGDLRPPAR